MKELIGKTELNMNELDQVAGGTWTVDTLTEEERAQWRALLQEALMQDLCLILWQQWRKSMLTRQNWTLSTGNK